MPKRKSEWVKRHLNDPYVKAAQDAGYRSRAFHKLLEMDTRFGLVEPNSRVLDLGGAPGSWSQYVTRKFSSCSVIAVDLLPIEALPRVTFLRANCVDQQVSNEIINLCQGTINLVLSDMAPDTTGITSCDHYRILELCRHAHYLAKQVLVADGALVVKIFQGGEEKDFARELAKDFTKVKFVKPKSSRSNSREMYLVALGFKKE